MIFRLAGLVSLGGMTLVKSTFLVPFFRSPTSNWLFAQELDPEQNILEFRLFDPFKYDILSHVCEPLERTPGDRGLLAYFRSNENVVVDNADAIATRLLQSSMTADESPFFEIEVGHLLRDVGRIRAAVHRASDSFGNSVGPLWAAREYGLAEPTAKTDWADRSGFQARLRDLRASYSNRDWHLRWHELWSASAYDPRVTNLGIDFVEYSISKKSYTEQMTFVLMWIAGRSRRALGPSFVDRVVSSGTIYLSEAHPGGPHLKRQTAENWVRIFLSVKKFEQKISDDDARFVLRYLEEGFDGKGLSRKLWTRMWSQLWRSGRYRPEATKALVNRLSMARSESLVFTNTVMKGVRGFLEDRELYEIAMQWLSEHINSSNAWIVVYLRVLAMSEGSPELLRLGETWLKQDPGHLARWPDVYNAIAKHTGESPELVTLARDWLLRANRSMLSWPQMALHLMGEHRLSDPSLVKAVRVWLSESPRSPYAWDLGSLIGDEDTQGQSAI